MRFSDSLWGAVEPIYRAIADHPFNQELARGTLPREKFAFYVQQDALYIADFARALSLMGSRSVTSERLYDFVKLAEAAETVEHSLHTDYLRAFDIGRPTAVQSPSCFAYTNFIIATAAHRSYEEGVACLLPCFWVYREVGHHIYRTALPNNPYQRWIDTYASPQFSLLVDKFIAICDETALEAGELARQRMRDAFVTSTRLEWMFWDSAYRMESWPP